MHHTRLAVLATTLLLAAPAVASADAPWGVTAEVGETVPGLKDPALAFASGGDGAYGASLSADPTRPAVPREGLLGRLATNGLPGALAPLGGDDLVAGPVAYGRSRTAILRTRLVRTTGDLFSPRVRLAVSYGTTTGGDAGTPRTLDADVKLAARPVLALDATGNGIAAWLEDRPAGDRLWVARKTGSAGFGRPSIVYGKGEMTALAAAVGPRGDFVVAATRDLGRDREVVARYRPAGRPVGPVQTLGLDEGLTQILARVSRSGRAVVAWGTQDAGIEATEPFRLRTAVKPAGGTNRFRAAQELQGGVSTNERTPGPIALELAADGTATVAWSTPQGGAGAPLSWPVRVATTDARAVFGNPQEVAPTGVVGGLAVRPGGAAVLTFARRVTGAFEADAAQAAVRPSAAAPFGAPETIAAQAVDEPPRVTLDPRGCPVALWTQILGPQQRALRLAARGELLP